MAQVSYEDVVKLVDQLSPEDQRALIAHLQATAQQRELSDEEWKLLYNSLKSDTPLLTDFSDRREDWYGEDGR